MSAGTMDRATSSLHVDRITVRFGGIVALNEVTFEVAPGTIHALIGPNGAGKSSLLNVLSGVYRPSSGQVRLGELVLSDLPVRSMAENGVARSFQNIIVSPNDTVMDNLLVGRHRLTNSSVTGALLRTRAWREDDRNQRARVREVAEAFGLGDHLDERAGVLPYGIQKRIDIARAVLADPRVLLLDEPVAGMNAAESAEIANLVTQLRDDFGMTVVLVEHDMGLVMSIADRVTVLEFGQVVADGTPAEVQADPEVQRAYMGTTPTLDHEGAVQ